MDDNAIPAFNRDPEFWTSLLRSTDEPISIEMKCCFNRDGGPCGSIAITATRGIQRLNISVHDGRDKQFVGTEEVPIAKIVCAACVDAGREPFVVRLRPT